MRVYSPGTRPFVRVGGALQQSAFPRLTLNMSPTRGLQVTPAITTLSIEQLLQFQKPKTSDKMEITAANWCIIDLQLSKT